MTADEITADFYGRWTEQTTPPCLYTVHPGGGKVRTDLPEEVRDYVMAYCDGAAVYGAAWNDENGHHRHRLPHQPCRRCGTNLPAADARSSFWMSVVTRW